MTTSNDSSAAEELALLKAHHAARRATRICELVDLYSAPRLLWTANHAVMTALGMKLDDPALPAIIQDTVADMAVDQQITQAMLDTNPQVGKDGGIIEQIFQGCVAQKLKAQARAQNREGHLGR